VSAGPPPVPGGRSPEEREAARREREARRAARSGKAPPPPAAPPPQPTAPPGDGNRDWLADAERLTDAATVGGANGDSAPPPPASRRSRRPGAGGPSAGGPPARAERGHPRWGRLVALALVVLLALGAAWLANSLFQPFTGDGEGNVRVVIPEGATLGEIAEQLEQRGVIESASFFELRARLAGRGGELKPGPYDLKADMSYVAVLDRLEEGVPPNVVVVTVPEGQSRAEVARIVKRLDGNYMRATRRHPALAPSDYRAEGATSLEGFLFPATYELKKGQPVRRLVGLQLAAFKESFDKVDLSYARRKNLTPYDVLIIASMVEREAQLDRERPLIASVIYNRLRRGEPLGIDATIRFALRQWRQPLRESELATPSPYNTRVNAGLPPGPIGSPGLASIRAAARPARTNHLFYVVKPNTCGKHAFSDTSAEFEQDVARYNAERAERGGKSPTNC